jgi:hypothetical protein
MPGIHHPGQVIDYGPSLHSGCHHGRCQIAQVIVINVTTQNPSYHGCMTLIGAGLLNLARVCIDFGFLV